MGCCRVKNRPKTWYNSEANPLDSQLEKWLRAVPKIYAPTRAIIVPHGCLKVTGPCMAHAYRQVQRSTIKRVFILGPVHRYFGSIEGCAVPRGNSYEMSHSRVAIDRRTCRELRRSGCFKLLNKEIAQKEYSIEMQLPFILKILVNKFLVVPIFIGHLRYGTAYNYAKILLKYFDDPENLFVISTDFCHWGTEHNLTYFESLYGKIYEYIKYLDKLAMDALTGLDPVEFDRYLESYPNNICGKECIRIFLYTINEYRTIRKNQVFELKFLNYTQSHKVSRVTEHCTTFVAGCMVVTMLNPRSIRTYRQSCGSSKRSTDSIIT